MTPRRCQTQWWNDKDQSVKARNRSLSAKRNGNGNVRTWSDIISLGHGIHYFDYVFASFEYLCVFTLYSARTYRNNMFCVANMNTHVYSFCLNTNENDKFCLRIWMVITIGALQLVMFLFFVQCNIDVNVFDQLNMLLCEKPSHISRPWPPRRDIHIQLYMYAYSCCMHSHREMFE